MQREAVAHARAAAGERPVLVRRSAFMRYAGQGHEITIALPDRPLAPTDAATFRQEFEREYARLFARFIPNALIEIMSWVVLATTATEPPAAPRGRRRAPAPTAVGERSVFDARLGRRLAVPVFERHRLAPGATLAGPRAHRRGGHHHLRLAQLRRLRRCRRRAGADGQARSELETVRST